MVFGDPPDEHLWFKSRPFSGRISRFAEFFKGKVRIGFKTETFGYLPVFANIKQLIYVTTTLVLTMTVTTKFMVTAGHNSCYNKAGRNSCYGEAGRTTYF